MTLKIMPEDDFVSSKRDSYLSVGKLLINVLLFLQPVLILF